MWHIILAVGFDKFQVELVNLINKDAVNYPG